MKSDGYLRAVASTTIVENPTASAATATVLGRVTGLHGALFVSIALAYYTNSKKQFTPTGSTFNLFARVRNEQGVSVRLSSTPVNGSSGQAAPNAWEGTTTAPELDVELAVVGVNDATSVGHWELVVTICPAISLCEAEFKRLVDGVGLEVSKVTL